MTAITGLTILFWQGKKEANVSNLSGPSSRDSRDIKERSGTFRGICDALMSESVTDAAKAQTANQKTGCPASPLKTPEPCRLPFQSGFSRHARNRFVIGMSFLISSFVFFLLIVLITGYAVNRHFREAGPLAFSRSIIIEQGTSFSAIARKLEEAGVIDSALVFDMGARIYRARSGMKAGEYRFRPSASMYEVMQILLSGKGVVHKITIPEGLTSFQIMRRIAKNEILTGPIPDVIPAEGSLMPDTYHFHRGLSRQKLVNRMMAAHRNFVQKIWETRDSDLPVSTPGEMVILASIVEKETARADERPHVASVFINRLVRGMKLQSDPTVIYGVFGGQGKPEGRPIYQSDLKNANGYNTYIIKALPQGPISNPGKESLRAVANPLQTRDLFFVSDGTGGHAFSDSLSAHNINVAKWREIERRMKKKRNQDKIPANEK